MTDDIVTTLRRESFYRPTSRLNSFGTPQMGFELTSFNLIAADEIERLRRDYSCICGEMRRMMDERDEARWRLCKVVGDNRGVWGCEIAKENIWDYLATKDKP